MLKKAGIIAAAVTAGVLAMSSLAFADTAKDNVTNDCAFGNMSGSASQVESGSDGLLGGVLSTFLGATTNAATQANTGNCTNLNVTDVLDQNSHNSSTTVDHAKIKDSYNGLAD